MISAIPGEMLGWKSPSMELGTRKADAQRRSDRRYELAKLAMIELISGPRDYSLATLPERALKMADELLAKMDEGATDANS